MNDKEKAVSTLQALRDAARQKAERALYEATIAQQNATAAQAQVKQLDTALDALNAFEEPGLRVGGKTSGGRITLVDAEIRDSVTYSARNVDKLDFTLKDLVSHDDLLAGIANPAVRGRNLRNIWERNITALLVSLNDGKPSATAGHDTALLIAENNNAPEGLALTSLDVRLEDKKGGASATIHVLRNNKQDRTLVVGAKALPQKLRAAFAKANIRYVDKTATDAVAQAAYAVKDVVGADARPSTYDRLLEAFKYRNGSDNLDQDRTIRDLPTALVDKKLEPFYPKYVVKKL